MNSKPEARLGLWLTWSLAVHAGLVAAWWVAGGSHSSTTVETLVEKNEVKKPTLKSFDAKIPATTDGGKVLSRVVTKPLAQAIKELPPSQRETILREVAHALDTLAQDRLPSELAAVMPSTVQNWQGGALVAQIVPLVLAHADQRVADALVTELTAASQVGATDATGTQLGETGDKPTITSNGDSAASGNGTSDPSDGHVGNTDSAPQTPSSSKKQDIRTESPGVNLSGGGRDVAQGTQGRISEGVKKRSEHTASSSTGRRNGSKIQEPAGKSVGSPEWPAGAAKRAGGISVKNQGGVQTSEAYQKLASQVAQRGLQAGSSWIQPSVEGPLPDPVAESGLIPTHVMGGSDVIAVPLGSSLSFKPEFPSLAFQVIPCLPSEFILDGSSEKWQKVPRLVMRPEWGTNASEQVVQVGWRHDGLYVRCEVSDPDHQIRHAQATRFWEGDNVEVWFDGQNLKRTYRSRTTGQHFWVWPEAAEDNVNQIGGEARIEQRGGGVEAFPFTKDRLTRAAMRTTSGWTVEFRLDKSMLINPALEPGRIIGFNVYLNTLSGTNWFWSAGKKANTWYQPDTWGDLLLAGSDAVLERAEVRTDGNFPPLVAGQPVRLRVTDADMDLDPTRPDRLEVTLQTDHGGIHRAVLIESGNSTGIFLGGIATTPALDEDPPGLLGVNPGERIKVTYVDQVRSDGAKNTEVVMILRAGAPVLVGDIERP